MSERPGGAPFINGLPQSVIDRFEAQQHTASAAADDTNIDVAQYYCPDNELGGKPGEDATTHHLVPRAKGQTCRYCGKTEKQLRTEIDRGM